jgi:hypothetical protein
MIEATYSFSSRGKGVVTGPRFSSAEQEKASVRVCGGSPANLPADESLPRTGRCNAWLAARRVHESRARSAWTTTNLSRTPSALACWATTSSMAWLSLPADDFTTSQSWSRNLGWAAIADSINVTSRRGWGGRSYGALRTYRGSLVGSISAGGKPREWVDCRERRVRLARGAVCPRFQAAYPTGLRSGGTPHFPFTPPFHPSGSESAGVSHRREGIRRADACRAAGCRGLQQAGLREI